MRGQIHGVNVMVASRGSAVAAAPGKEAHPTLKAMRMMRMRIRSQPATRMMRATLRAADVRMTKICEKGEIADGLGQHLDVFYRREDVMDDLHDPHADEPCNRG